MRRMQYVSTEPRTVVHCRDVLHTSRFVYTKKGHPREELLSAAFINPSNNGCGLRGRDWNSG